MTTPTAWPQWQPEPTIELHAAAAIAEEFIPQPVTHTVSGLPTLINIFDYSTLNRLLAVTAYTCRYINNLHKSRPKLGGPLTATELNSAQTKWVQACQEPMEMASARSKCDRPAVKRPPLVRQLRMFVDDKGLLRCGGQIHNAPLSELARFPYLLPPHHHLTTLIVKHMHALLFHAGIGATYLDSTTTVLLGVSVSREYSAAVQFVEGMVADHTLLQRWHHFQKSMSEMYHPLLLLA